MARATARAASALVRHESWAVALERAADQVLLPGDVPPDVVVVFASKDYAGDYHDLTAAAVRRLGTTNLFGCSVDGFLSGRDEVEREPGLSLMAMWLPDVELHLLRLASGAGTARALREADPAAADRVHGWLMLAEPFRMDALGLIHDLKREFPDVPIVGGMASGMDRERTGCVFLGEDVYEDGAVALGFGGPYALSAGVSQGSVPIGEPWTITEVERNVLLGVSNRPALEMLKLAIDGLSVEQRERAQNNVLVGLAVDEYLESYGQGDFFVRGILGIDPKRGAVVVGGMPRVGQTVQFHLREAALATDDLVATMLSLRECNGVPVAAVLCTCDGRGERLFGERGHDAGLVSDGLPGIPLVGAFCPGEIGPLGKTIVMHGFTATVGVLARIDE
jgi:small ligand-binding sensory domain FIST